MPSPQPRRSTPLATEHGVTLVEILVVIALIAILAGVLFPLLSTSRENARTTSCANNLRQLHTAYSLYTADFGFIPPYQNRQGAGFSKGHGLREVSVPDRCADLVRALQPYTTTPGLWFCPADRYARTNSEAAAIRHRYASYSVGLFGSWLGYRELGEPGTPITMDGPVNGSGTTRPAQATLLTDNLWSLDLDGSTSRPDYSHGDRFNYLFFDGHVKPYRRDSRDCPLP